MAKSYMLDSSVRRRLDTNFENRSSNSTPRNNNEGGERQQEEQPAPSRGIGSLISRVMVAGALLVFLLQHIEYQQKTFTGLRPRRRPLAPLLPTPKSEPELAAYNNKLLSKSYDLAATDSALGQSEVRNRRDSAGHDSYTTQNIGSWYYCNPALCKLPDCQCASQKPPAGLDKSVVPQFVIFTIDDAVHENVIKPPLDALQGIRNHGCPVKATYFVSGEWTNYHDLQELWAQGHEIAGHTFSHTANPTADDISAMRQAAEQFSQIPANQINGFRAPSLRYSLNLLSTLRSLGFDYDSSMTVFTNGNNTVWPFTFDYGMPLSCATGDCAGATPPAPNQKAWKVPGLWEIPVYTLKDPKNSDANWPIDPPMEGDELLTILRNNFDDHYKGNRAPFGIHIHSAWLMAVPSRIKTLNAFMQELSGKKEVRITTNQELLTWLRNPKPLSEMSALCSGPKIPPSAVEICDGVDNNGNGLVDEGVQKECNFGMALFQTCASSCPIRYPSVFEPVPQPSNPSSPGSACHPPVGGCMYGTFNSTACACSCFGPLPNNTGSCPSDKTTGQCNVYRVPSRDSDTGFLDCSASSKVIVEDRKEQEDEFKKKLEDASTKLNDHNGGDHKQNDFDNRSAGGPSLWGAIVVVVIISFIVLLGEL